MTITEFLLPRIAEDESKAQAANSWSDRDWNRHKDIVFADNANPIVQGFDSDQSTETILEHVATWDPYRVRMECKAKRAIIEVETLRYCDNVPRSGFISLEVADSIRGRADTPILRALAAVYADHPDYQPEWRPE